MKKVISILLCVVLSVIFCGCGETGGSGFTSNKKLNVNDLSIEDFEIDVKERKIDEYKVYTMNLTNNSKYDILGTQIDYRVKSDVNAEQLKVFDNFMDEHKDYFDNGETPYDITLTGSKEKLIKSGESISKIVLCIGMQSVYWYDTPSSKQFELMEPELLQFMIVGEDDTVYLAYYYFESDEWELDEVTKELNKWPENDMANKVPQPESNYILVTSDEYEDDVDFSVYGCSIEEFRSYVQSVIDAGFDVDPTEDYKTYFSSKDNDGNIINISYDKDDNIMEVNTY